MSGFFWRRRHFSKTARPFLPIFAQRVVTDGFANVRGWRFSINPTRVQLRIWFHSPRAFRTKLPDRYYHRSPLDEQPEERDGEGPSFPLAAFFALWLRMTGGFADGVVRTRLEGWWERASVRFFGLFAFSTSVCFLLDESCRRLVGGGDFISILYIYGGKKLHRRVQWLEKKKLISEIGQQTRIRLFLHFWRNENQSVYNSNNTKTLQWSTTREDSTRPRGEDIWRRMSILAMTRSEAERASNGVNDIQRPVDGRTYLFVKR